MKFLVKNDKFNGIIRSFKENNYPKIELKPSSYDQINPVENILDYGSENKHWVSNSDEGLKAQLVVKIVDDLFLITHYSIRSHFSEDPYIQKWTFEGSYDNNEYFTLHEPPQCDDLKSNGIGFYKVNPHKKGFKYFRIKQTMSTTGGYSNMRITNLEFFGIYPFSCQCPKTCRNSRNNHISLLFLFCFIVNSR